MTYTHTHTEDALKKDPTFGVKNQFCTFAKFYSVTSKILSFGSSHMSLTATTANTSRRPSLECYGLRPSLFSQFLLTTQIPSLSLWFSTLRKSQEVTWCQVGKDYKVHSKKYPAYFLTDTLYMHKSSIHRECTDEFCIALHQTFSISSSFRFVDGLSESASQSTVVRATSEAVVPVFALSFGHEIIVEDLLNLLDALNLRTTKLLTESWVTSLLDASRKIQQM